MGVPRRASISQSCFCLLPLRQSRGEGEGEGEERENKTLKHWTQNSPSNRKDTVCHPSTYPLSRKDKIYRWRPKLLLRKKKWFFWVIEKSLKAKLLRFLFSLIWSHHRWSVCLSVWVFFKEQASKATCSGRKSQL